MISKKLEAFSIIETALGKRIGYKYAVIDSEKNTIDTENKGNIVAIMNEELLENIKQIEDFIMAEIKKIN